MYYGSPSENVHSIKIYCSNPTRQKLKDYLTYFLDSKEKSNNILNLIIFGEIAYAEGELTIIRRQNEIVNIKEETCRISIKKRVMDKNYYFEYFFKYDFRNNKYKFKVIKNESGILSDVTDKFEEGEVIPELIRETNILGYHHYYPNINIINDESMIISGCKGILEISDAEISLYSPEQIDNDSNSLKVQRYQILKNDTREIVGYIKFDFYYTNISYAIEEKHQGHHYASKALKLMIELIKNNVNFQRDNLYVRIDEKNLASIKTAEACDLLQVDNFGPIKKYIVNPQKILTVE